MIGRNGSYFLWIGSTDQLAINVSVILPAGSNKANPRDSADKIDTAVVEHLKGTA